MPRPFPDPNISTPERIWQYADTVTSGFLSTLTVLSIYVVVFIWLKTKLYKTSEAAAVAGWISLVLSSLLWTLGSLKGNVLVTLLVITVLATIWGFFEKDYP